MSQMVSAAATPVARLRLSVLWRVVRSVSPARAFARNGAVLACSHERLSHHAAAALQEAQPLGSAVRNQDPASPKGQGTCLRRACPRTMHAGGHRFSGSKINSQGVWVEHKAIEHISYVHDVVQRMVLLIVLYCGGRTSRKSSVQQLPPRYLLAFSSSPWLKVVVGHIVRGQGLHSSGSQPAPRPCACACQAFSSF